MAVSGAEHLRAQGLPGAAGEGAAAVQRLEQGDAEAVLVGAGVGGAAEVELRGHVGRGAALGRVGGLGAVVQLVLVGGVGGQADLAPRSAGRGEAEVDDAGAALLVDDHVLGLEVAVDDALAVGGGEALPGAEEHRADLRPGVQLSREPGKQGGAADELHGDEQVAVDLADVEDAGDVGVG